VPFNGNPQVIAAMLKNEVQIALLPPALAMAQVKAGKLKAIGVTSPDRSPLVNELPTLREADVRGADLEIWTALAAPSTMPDAAVDKLNAALDQVLRAPDVGQALLKAGWQARAGSAAALAKRMRSDTTTLGGVILMRGIKETA
jgi:tripartite-type tricarboxylate transporter receptor subunit TctC